MPAYDLPPLRYEEQLKALEKRGLEIERRREATEVLATVGYTRLSSYWKHRVERESKEFIPGATFSEVYDRYQFDSRLRQVSLYGINHIEVALRSALVYHNSHELGTGFWISDFKVFNNPIWQSNFVRKVIEGLKSSKETWAKEYKSYYKSKPSVPPAWIALQFASFGDLSAMLKSTTLPNVRGLIAERYAVDHSVILSWMQTLHKLRNACAHHARIWNRNLATQPTWPKSLAKNKDHWVSSWEPSPSIEETAYSKFRNLGVDEEQGLTIYAALCTMKYMLDHINPHHTFVERLTKAMKPHLKKGFRVDIEAGFPEHWLSENLWTR